MTRHSICALAGGLLLCAMASCGIARAQSTLRFAATTGDVAVSAATYAATLQQPATNASNVIIDQIVVYSSAAATITQAANGAAATATAGTVTPILPYPANAPITATFWKASNVGAGTTQGGALHIPPGGTATICLSRACGAANDVVLPAGGNTATNYTISFASLTATVNVTFLCRIVQ